MNQDLRFEILEVLLSSVGKKDNAPYARKAFARFSEQLANALLHLEQKGMVDARRCRLTLRGLHAALVLREHAMKYAA